MGTFELSTMHWMGISDLTHANYRPLMQVNADAAALIVQQDAPWKAIQDLVDHRQGQPWRKSDVGHGCGGAGSPRLAGNWWRFASRSSPVGADFGFSAFLVELMEVISTWSVAVFPGRRPD